MIDLSESVKVITSPWQTEFYDLVNGTRFELMVVSPFIGGSPLYKVADTIAKRQDNRIAVNIVTNLSVDNLLGGTVDPNALLYVAEHVPQSTITYLPGLHAKVYIADSCRAVITSANLTNNGLLVNCEYGVLISDSGIVSKIRQDIAQYASLGNVVSFETIQQLCKVTQELKHVRYEAEKSIRTELRKAFAERVEAAKVELLKARARDKTTHGIFSETVLYLLEQKGPLRTAELHPLIQAIHPDICDDMIDRVIDGVHFGKKWKHHVRNAQQSLKNQGRIGFDGEFWYFTESK